MIIHFLVELLAEVRITHDGAETVSGIGIAIIKVLNLEEVVMDALQPFLIAFLPIFGLNAFEALPDEFLLALREPRDRLTAHGLDNAVGLLHSLHEVFFILAPLEAIIPPQHILHLRQIGSCSICHLVQGLIALHEFSHGLAQLVLLGIYCVCQVVQSLIALHKVSDGLAQAGSLFTDSTGNILQGLIALHEIGDGLARFCSLLGQQAALSGIHGILEPAEPLIGPGIKIGMEADAQPEAKI